MFAAKYITCMKYTDAFKQRDYCALSLLFAVAALLRLTLNNFPIAEHTLNLLFYPSSMFLRKREFILTTGLAYAMCRPTGGRAKHFLIRIRYIVYPVLLRWHLDTFVLGHLCGRWWKLTFTGRRRLFDLWLCLLKRKNEISLCTEIWKYTTKGSNFNSSFQ